MDANDRLVDADADFAAFNTRAGGAQGHPLGAPQLARVVRLARRLRVPVIRPLVLPDGDLDVDCWVRAVPEGDGVALSVSPVRERPPWRATGASAAHVPPPPGADWTWEADAALRLTRISAEAEARHGVDAAAAIGRPLTRLFALDATGDGALPLLEALAAREGFEEQAATLRGTGQRVTLAGQVRYDAGGVFAGFVGGVFTEQSAEAAGEIAPGFNTRLEGILRAPLGRIIAHADSINAGEEGAIEPHYAGYAADIASAGRHLMALVDDLSDIEAIERADFAVEAERLDLADVVRRAAGLLAVRAAEAGVTIDRGNLDQPLYVMAEFRRVLQIMVNLIGNAVRYSPRGATVWLRLQRASDSAVAIVADQGKGIAAEDQERIFGKFERVDRSEPGGSGLGLYIARRLARAMGGDLTVDSAPDEGARFILTLPTA